MSTICGNWDEFSSIPDRGEIGFIDYDDDKSVCSYNPDEEGPIVVSVPFPVVNGKPQSISVGETASDLITIRNTTMEPVELWKVDIYDSNPKDSFTISLMEPPSPTSDMEYIREFLEYFCLDDRVLQPGQTLSVWLSCKPKGVGLHTTAVHFDVGDDRIERVVLLLAEDKISKSLASNKPYRRDRKKKPLVVDAYAVDAYVLGARPAKASTRGPRFCLPSYPIPKDIRKLVENKDIPTGITEGLKKENYCNYFTTLLNMEEIKMEEDMRGYDMECIVFGKKGPFLTLEVPGLAEKRPSLVCGDFIYAKLASEDANDRTRPYQGYIYRVEAEEVHLKFDEEFHFHHKAGKPYNVQFTYNRINMRRLYQAVLVCAPSNSAADLILEKLLCEKVVAVEERDILRLNAPSRSIEDIKSDFHCFCFFEESAFTCPPLKKLIRYKIVISTYMSAALLYAEGVRRGHFSHIFLDEAGQASEPDTMIPVSQLCRRGTVVVLAGDPMQLGPVIHSKDAETYGLGKSYLSRLFECELYDPGNENYVTKLDLYWNMFLWRCVDNGSYQGCPLPERQNSPQECPAEENNLGYEEENPQPSDEVECEEQTHQAEEFNEPVFDETEWSDGWK
ncbi:hypothetical protein TEA_023853 [Camellia sinensis var. sinensis]|uniref:Uncharacterized protein n=1 Tax=Camellia sinensis var. sinensis TaxID=542762 RepID=A0A4S4DAL9_CAMSN|nr:hypothetical protein TEA_023853 [Camellia sinensis var. sinensis]